MSQVTVNGRFGTRRVGQWDRVFSELHGKWVRLLGVEADGYLEVGDSESLKPLADLVHPTQLA